MSFKEHLRQRCQRGYVAYVAIMLCIALPYCLVAGLARHARNAWFDLREDLATLQLRKFLARSYWEKHIREAR